ncbi:MULTISPECIES: HNH endonuclease [unclassified Pseudomonas]|uniref:HNH endonuclease n=1 Tax=unclassified Pseudomonas TaxID=196821 RepID=UPI0014632D93|nr:MULTISPECIES: HNH endonuclease [unclassified Pseudomonas]QJI19791.1 HNH endonuclease [Pseudomonas sp. ADAK21]QJI25052.1 HNH endonuclease [Pseudomonas sp. ADAK20]
MAKGWSNEELLASVEAYRQMAEKQQAGVGYSKKQVYEELAAQFDRTPKAFEYRMQNISAVFDELGLPWIPGLKPAVNVGTAMKATLIQLIQGKTPEDDAQPGGLEDSRNWEKALAAVEQLGGSASRKQVEAWILAREPEFNTNNLTDLYMMSVNARARGGYTQNKKPRRTDQGNRYDRLFNVGKATFELYDPVQHGIWEIYTDVSSGSRFGVSVRQVTNPVEEALAVAQAAAEQADIFDPTDVADARKRVTADIIRRRGQPAFRKALLQAYGEACAITGCNLTAVLEAAHIHPYKGDHTNVVSNGLLLRTDIHTLFDLGLIAIESDTLVVRVSPQLEGTDYGKLNGSPLRQPEQKAHRVSSEALDWHWSQSGWCD